MNTNTEAKGNMEITMNNRKGENAMNNNINKEVVNNNSEVKNEGGKGTMKYAFENVNKGINIDVKEGEVTIIKTNEAYSSGDVQAICEIIQKWWDELTELRKGITEGRIPMQEGVESTLRIFTKIDKETLEDEIAMYLDGIQDDELEDDFIVNSDDGWVDDSDCSGFWFRAGVKEVIELVEQYILADIPQYDEKQGCIIIQVNIVRAYYEGGPGDWRQIDAGEFSDLRGTYISDEEYEAG